MIVGLTGGIASGKTTVQNFFSALGVPTTSADVIAREILEQDATVFNAVIDKFNHSRVTTDNKLDRKKLRQQIFDSDADRIWLENLLHPLIKIKIKEFAQHCYNAYCIIEIPLLFEAKWLDCVDRILIVDTSNSLQLQRACARDNLAATEIQKIMDTQLTREQRLQQQADVIENTGDLAALEQAVYQRHLQYQQLSTVKAP